jgi:hypothetical protein
MSHNLGWLGDKQWWQVGDVGAKDMGRVWVSGWQQQLLVSVPA